MGRRTRGGAHVARDATDGPVRSVAILAPMPSELRPLIAPLGLSRAPGRDDGLLRGGVGRVEVVACLTGIGMSAGARAAQRVLEATSPDRVVVVGIAGGIGPGIAVGDLIAPALVLDLATGASFRPAPLGDEAPLGTLASSDALVEGPEAAARLADRGVVAVDMETAAIAAVCEARGCPWSVVRAVSDRADDGTTDGAILGLVHPDGRPDLPAVARLVLRRPGRLPQLVRLGRGTRRATRAAARATVEALSSL